MSLKPVLLSDAFENNVQSVIERLKSNSSCSTDNINITIETTATTSELNLFQKIKDNIGILFFIVVILFVLYNMKVKKNVKKKPKKIQPDPKMQSDYVYIPKSIGF
jgi:hypothetical protein